MKSCSYWIPLGKYENLYFNGKKIENVIMVAAKFDVPFIGDFINKEDRNRYTPSGKIYCQKYKSFYFTIYYDEYIFYRYIIHGNSIYFWSDMDAMETFERDYKKKRKLN